MGDCKISNNNVKYSSEDFFKLKEPLLFLSSSGG